MDDFEYSLEIIIVPLKERIAENNFFFGNKHTIAEKIVLKQWITARSPVKINTVSLKEWMTATISVTSKYLTAKEGWP